MVEDGADAAEPGEVRAVRGARGLERPSRLPRLPEPELRLAALGERRRGRLGDTGEPLEDPFGSLELRPLRHVGRADHEGFGEEAIVHAGVGIELAGARRPDDPRLGSDQAPVHRVMEIARPLMAFPVEVEGARGGRQAHLALVSVHGELEQRQRLGRPIERDERTGPLERGAERRPSDAVEHDERLLRIPRFHETHGEPVRELDRLGRVTKGTLADAHAGIGVATRREERVRREQRLRRRDVGGEHRMRERERAIVPLLEFELPETLDHDLLAIAQGDLREDRRGLELGIEQLRDGFPDASGSEEEVEHRWISSLGVRVGDRPRSPTGAGARLRQGQEGCGASGAWTGSPARRKRLRRHSDMRSSSAR